MIGLLTLLTAGPALADSMCAQKKPFVTEFVINLETPEPYYDLSKNKVYLNHNSTLSKEEWLTKNNMQGVWSSKHMTTLGQASGGWAANYQWEFDPQPLDQYWAYACLYIKRLEINMIYRTMIMIPSDYPKTGCEFEVIHEHELKHYKVNRMVVLKTAKKLEEDMPKVIAELEKQHVGSDAMQARADDIRESILELVDVYFKQVMREEMSHLNGLVDSPEEYGSHDKYVAACEARRQKKAPYTVKN